MGVGGVVLAFINVFLSFRYDVPSTKLVGCSTSNHTTVYFKMMYSCLTLSEQGAGQVG